MCIRDRPGGERKIELTYSQVLPNEGGLIHYRYPLRTQPLVTPGGGVRYVQPISQLVITTDIVTTSPLKAIYSPTYPVVTTRNGDYSATVSYEASNVTPTADFDLYFSVDQSDIGLSLLTYKPAGEDGFFLLLAAPKVEVDSQQIVARDVLLVLDTSGSMEGQKIEQARSALLFVLEHLNPQDRFNVVSFNTGVRQFETGLQPMSRAAEAKQFVSELQAGGSTDINRALLEALQSGRLDAAYLGNDRSAQVAADVAFHLTIAESAHNVLFGHLVSSVLRLLHERDDLGQGRVRADLGGTDAEGAGGVDGGADDRVAR